MDSNRTKRRSFSKPKLIIKSLYRAAKPSTAANSAATPYEVGVTNQPTKPKPAPSPSSAAVGFIIVNQEQVFPQPAPKLSYVMAERNRGRMENFYGGAVDDEGVDAKAAKYISTVQERFRLERVNSERKNYQDIPV